MYDIIIVGGGIAGLYSAYTILRDAPQTKLLLLEKYKKKWLGGRMGNELFYGTQIVNGAGVGRKKKDRLLLDLLHELRIPVSEFQASHDYSEVIQPPCRVKHVFDEIKKEYLRSSSSIHVTFKKFATDLLGKKEYQHFITCSGYSDYELADVYDTLFHYGFDDNCTNWTGLSIDWKLLVEVLYKTIGSSYIKVSNEVTRIVSGYPLGFEIYIKDRSQPYSCKKVILATTIVGIRSLVPQKHSLYREIHGQPFLRVYGKFSRSSVSELDRLVSGQTIVPGPLQKIIPMNADKGVYMIAYSDNQSATMLHPYIENTAKNRELFCRLVETALGLSKGSLELIAIKGFYWTIGTHYFDPLDTRVFSSREEFLEKAQHPMPGMLVVGEAVSLHQGWVEGALESVKKVITPSWIHK